MSLAILADKLHAKVIAAMRDSSPACIFLSASDMKSRAITRHAYASSAEEAWQMVLESLKEILKKRSAEPTILRADWVTTRQKVTWGEAKRRITGTRRNYFRYGIAFDADWKIAITEQEFNGNSMLYSGGDDPFGKFNANNCAVYTRWRFGSELSEPDIQCAVELFETKGMFCELEGPVYTISGIGPDAGRRDIKTIDDATIRSCIVTGADWLARQCRPDGRFNYGFFPCFDRAIPTYNTLRHISSTWALLDVYKLTGSKALRAAAERAISYIIKHFARRFILPDGKEALFFEDKESNEIKLGSSGVALLLFTTYTELIHPKRYVALMNSVARGIMYLQNAEGSFSHVLDSRDFSIKDAFRIVYYDGEAVFGLLRLYSITHAPALLEAAEKAFDCFIKKNHWKHHDHWLSYSVNELTRWKSEARYFEFGINNFLNYLSFVRNRETAFPTLLELMMAAEAMLRRMESMPEMKDLLTRVDQNRFYDALEYRAGYLLNSFFWPETAMFYKNPQRIDGSFYIRHHAFRTRIDDIEHFLSGLTSYLRYLEEQGPNRRAMSMMQQAVRKSETKPCTSFGWTADELADITGGEWTEQPPSDWVARGLCVYAPAFEPGQILLVRSKDETGGIAPIRAKELLPLASGVICSDSAIYSDRPCLIVHSLKDILLPLARDARSRFTGRVIGITGTSGKTSFTSLMAHTLKAHGTTGQSRASANMVYGIAWNLASMPWDAAFQVVEMAIGKMDRNSALARPDVAVILNIAPAHLIYWKDQENIARMKSRIFDSMAPGAKAILNRDMPYYEIFEDKVRARGMDLVTFGTHAEADVWLKNFSAEGTCFTSGGQEYTLQLSAFGKHAAMNCLAAVATLKALDLPVEKSFNLLSSFTPPEGRGRRYALQVCGKKIMLIDDAYNANPESMRSSLDTMALTRPADGSDLIILGDMLELGQDSAKYHLDLITPLKALRPCRILLCGGEMKVLQDTFAQDCAWFPDVQTLLSVLPEWLQDGDRVLVKGSHGSEVWKVVEFLRRQDESRHPHMQYD